MVKGSMSTRLFVAPAGAGKTAFVIEYARATARDLRASSLVLLPSAAQAEAFRRRLAASGALGVQVNTFSGLYRAILNRAGAPIITLTDPARYRVLRDQMDALHESGHLVHYEPLRQRPGFIRVLSELIHEFKQGMISPNDLYQAWAAYPGSGPRLEELTTIYASYQQRLDDQRWADVEGVGGLAVEALRSDDRLGREWPIILVDGFDSYNTLQLCTLEILSQRAESLIITLTGNVHHTRPLAHKRFVRTRERLERTFHTHAEPLPEQNCGMDAALCYIEAHLFEQHVSLWNGQTTIELLEAPNRLAEAREALRWCKERLVLDRMRPSEVAILARNVEPYRSFLVEAAREFNLPVRLSSGFPLGRHLLIAALLDLLALIAPVSDEIGPALPRRLVVEAWRNPYFDWGHALRDPAGAPLAIEPGDADLLDDCARQGLVIEGWEQWHEALQRLAQEHETANQEENERSYRQVEPEQARLLCAKFQAFVERLTPPNQGNYADYVAWLQGLIGDDPLVEPDETPDDRSLNIIARIRREATFALEDLQALAAFTDILRSLVWAEAMGGVTSFPFARFLAELKGAVETTSYQIPWSSTQDDVLIASVFDARGLSFRAIAIIGLAEGEFPTILREDPFLRDDERRFLQERGLSIAPKLDGDEAGYFYEAITRAREKLLFTRPRLAEDGSAWQPSPYWDELRRLVPVTPQILSTIHSASAQRAASLEELLEWRASQHSTACDAWLQRQHSEHWEAVLAGAQVLNARIARQPQSEYEGDLGRMADHLAKRYGSRHVWSASALESYRACPFLFYVSRALGLEPRALPQEGFNVTQRGMILHRILETVYAQAHDKRDCEELLGLLPSCAEQVLADAPEHYGFRPTAWWQVTCQEIVNLVRHNIEALNSPDTLGQWTPTFFEQHFGLGSGSDPLVICCGGEEIRLHGVIDRVDIAPAGNIRVIDYKSSSKNGYDRKELDKGKKLQLPIYALAARDALTLGEPVDGFYWHLASAEASGLKLGDYGPAEAFERATTYCIQAVENIRAGRFAPQPADNRCPAWCPATGFCWRYSGPAF